MELPPTPDEMLLIAAESGNTPELRNALAQGAHVNTMGLIDGRTALNIAAQSGHAEIVKILLDAGAQIDSRDAYGRTALSWQASEDNFKMVEFLLRHGANPHLRDRHGRTALHRATRGSNDQGNPAIAVELLNYGADINAQDSDGQTPLMIALANHDIQMVTLLLARGADDVHALFSTAYSHRNAAVSLNPEDAPYYHAIARTLLRFGAVAHPNLTNFISEAFADEPLNLAAVKGVLGKVEALAKVASEEELNEALMYALGQRRFAIVHWLLSHCAHHRDTVIHHIGCLLLRPSLSPKNRLHYQSIRDRILAQITRRLPLREQIIRRLPSMPPEALQKLPNYQPNCVNELNLECFLMQSARVILRA